MAIKKRHWFWNLLLVLTIAGCGLAFVAHYKNWIWMEKDQLKILSGLYYKKLAYSELNSVSWVEKIPPMERINGFSAGDTEKGIFRDSLRVESKVYVYVDNLSHPKLKLVHKDSLELYINLADSLETQTLFLNLEAKIDSIQKQFSQKK